MLALPWQHWCNTLLQFTTSFFTGLEIMLCPNLLYRVYFTLVEYLLLVTLVASFAQVPYWCLSKLVVINCLQPCSLQCQLAPSHITTCPYTFVLHSTFPFSRPLLSHHACISLRDVIMVRS